MECDISVLILQYNPDYTALQRTVESILNQKNISFEIVIADDGSVEDYMKQMRQYFQTKQFQKYCLVKNEQNKGTVKNLQTGLAKCKGRYVKCISPGDYLYKENTLDEMRNQMDRQNAKFLFGKLAFYSCDTNGIHLYKNQLPYYPDIYDTQNYDSIRKRFLIYQDNVPGAAACIDKELLVKLMKFIDGKVVYQEDVSFSLVTFLNEKMIYFHEYVVWYEYGNGASTSGNEVWVKRLQKDTLSYYTELLQNYRNELYVKRAHRLQKLEMRSGIIWKMIKTLLYPDRFCYIKLRKRGLKHYSNPEDIYLKKILNEK